MSTESESAEQIVRLSLEGFDIVLRLTGTMAKNFGAMLYAMSKDKKKNPKGQQSLTKMLKMNEKLTIFSIKLDDYKDFKESAKHYKIPYSAIYNKNKNTSDGLVDLIIRENDSVIVNRIVERYNITSVDVEKVEKVLDGNTLDEQMIENKIVGEQEVDKEVQEKNTSPDLLNILMKKNKTQEENENINPSSISSTEKDTQLEYSLKKNEKNEKVATDNDKPSMREEIERITEQISKEKEKKKPQELVEDKKQTNIVAETKHEQPKVKNKKRKEHSKV